MKIDATKDLSVLRFRAVLLTAAQHLSVVEPEQLREPIEVWLRAQEERASREDWKSLLGQDVSATWHAAVAILEAAGVGLPDEP